jgi:hypothetical protein
MGTYHKLYNTIRPIVVNPKTDKKNLFGVIYEIVCPDCQQTYVGETSRALEARLKEHAANRDHSQQLENIE